MLPGRVFSSMVKETLTEDRPPRQDDGWTASTVM